MPPPKSSIPRSSKRNKAGAIQKFIDSYLNIDYVKYLLFDPSALPLVTVFILIAEFLLNVFVINRVPYTEIDWIAYMQECEGFLNGTTNYAELKGDTGPLVYPAAFVYIYSALYYITGHGARIRIGQYIFAGLYLLQMWLVLRIYAKSRKLPPYALMISAFTSYRIHSIYILRLFNDPVAIVFLYGALNLFLDRHWTLGSLCFSLGVGVKMNVLLFAPALLLFYLTNLGYLRTVVQLAFCGLVQLVIGAPFLLTHPVQYLRGSFDLGRVFEHKWTVNYRFLPRELFENKLFHLSLLAVHLILLAVFARPTYTFFKNYVRLRELQNQLLPQIKKKNQQLENAKKSEKSKKAKPKPKVDPKTTEEEFTPEQQSFLKSFESSLQKATGLKAPRGGGVKEESAASSGAGLAKTDDEKRVFINFDQCTQLALLPLFLCNFIGVACARSLHYQFYVWYFHSLPYLAWSTEYTLGVRFLLLGLIEFCWNTYPSTAFSSYTLHLCHVVLLYGVGRIMFKTTGQSALVRQAADAKQSKLEKRK